MAKRPTTISMRRLGTVWLRKGTCSAKHDHDEMVFESPDGSLFPIEGDGAHDIHDLMRDARKTSSPPRRRVEGEAK